MQSVQLLTFTNIVFFYENERVLYFEVIEDSLGLDVNFSLVM